MSVFKAVAIARDLKDRISLGMADLTVSQLNDSNGFPIIKVAKGADVMYLKVIESDNKNRIDGLGLPQRVYSPHIIQVLEESLGGTVLITEIGMLQFVIVQAAKCGSKVSIYSMEDLASATIDPDHFTAGATALMDIEADILNPILSSQ